jgi:hypothetical protein
LVTLLGILTAFYLNTVKPALLCEDAAVPVVLNDGGSVVSVAAIVEAVVLLHHLAVRVGDHESRAVARVTV